MYVLNKYARELIKPLPVVTGMLSIQAAEHAVSQVIPPAAVDRALAQAAEDDDEGSLLSALLDQLDRLLVDEHPIGRVQPHPRSLIERIADSLAHKHLLPQLQAVCELVPDEGTGGADYTNLADGLSQLSVSSTEEHGAEADSEFADRSSIPSSAFSLKSTNHSRVREVERFDPTENPKRKSKAALKHAHHLRQPGTPDKYGQPTWLMEHDGIVVCTNESMSRCLSLRRSGGASSHADGPEEPSVYADESFYDRYDDE